MKNIQRKECLYAKKWQEIWDGDKNASAYKKLEGIMAKGITMKRSDYGRFWRVKK